MRFRLFFTCPLAFCFAALLNCRKVYNPPATRGSNHFVAIDGTINSGTDAVTIITLTRSANLSDSVTNIPELGAQVSISSDNGAVYALTDTGNNGNYLSAPLSLPATGNYQVLVTTSDGNKYSTDPAAPKTAALLDSLEYEVVNDPITGAQVLNIYIDGHDPGNNTHFYRWDYLETWEHHSELNSPWLEANGRIYPLPVGESTSVCWSTALSAHIVLGSSVALSEDRIAHLKVATFNQNDPKLDIGYSILVRQYPLSLTAFNYWTGVEKNSESLGGLFDLQPSQVNGNFHSLSHPNDPALGYVSVSGISEKRLFINNDSLPGWKSNHFISCQEIAVTPASQLDLLAYDYPDTSYSIYHFNGTLFITQQLAPKACLYCSYAGGTTIKPSFWP